VTNEAGFIPPDLSALSDTPTYPIGAVARLTGVPQATLRAWERRYGIPRPGRTETAYRLYSEREAGLVRWMKATVEAGLPAGRAAAMIRSLLDADRALSAHGQVPVEALRHRLLDASRDLDEGAFAGALAEVFAFLPVETAFAEVIFPFLIRLGEAWAAGEIPVAGEHFASQIIRSALLGLFRAAPLADGPTVLVGCPPGEQHELGGLLLALLCRRRRARVIWLGPDLPVDDWVESVRRHRPLLVALSAISPSGLPGLHAVATALARLPVAERPVLAIGGHAVAPELRTRLGALEFGANAVEASSRIAAFLITARLSRPPAGAAVGRESPATRSDGTAEEQEGARGR
jgi:DNA-binding transcriptional MerR regulator